MKFFTPDLYVRLQSSDEAELDAADAAWQRAEAAYDRHLQAIRSKLPGSALKLLDGPRLHDAEVLWMGHVLPLFFGIILQLDTPARTTIGLTCLLTSQVELDKETIPPQHRSPLMQWMYDEISVGTSAHSFEHSILFSNGWLLKVQASEVHLATLDTVYAHSAAGIPA